MSHLKLPNIGNEFSPRYQTKEKSHKEFLRTIANVKPPVKKPLVYLKNER